MRKMIALGLCLFMLASFVLTSCQSNGTPSEETKKETQDMSGETDGSETNTKENESSETDTGDKTVKYDGYKLPCIVETLFTKDVIVADAVVTNTTRNKADPTGQEDSTKAINAQIKAVYNNGGGTVYMPAGQYKVTGTIEVLPFVSLVGDYDEKGTGQTGTVILAEMANAADPVFKIGGSAGVVGLSVYYPGQTIESVIPYGYTFDIPGGAAGAEYYMLSTVKDCKVFNGYQGVHAGSVNEQFNIENLCGTFLRSALDLYDSADASTVSCVRASASYWAECSLGSAPLSKIISYTQENGEAFIFGDLEWVSFASLFCESYETGMHIVKGPRAKFSGLIYDLTIDDCEHGLLVEDIDERPGYGMCVTGGLIQGYEYAVMNQTSGKVQLTAVEIDGTVLKGDRAGAQKPIVNEVSESIPDDLSSAPVCPVAKSELVVVTGANDSATKDASDAIQNALDSLNGKGGIVYLKAGFYRIDKPLQIPENVELRGAGHVPVRDQMSLSMGTVIFSKVDLFKDGAQPNVTLQKGSGLRNIIFINIAHDLLSDFLNNDKSFAPSVALVRGTGQGCYIYNSSLCGAPKGIEMIDADDFHISHLSLLAYETGIRAVNCRNSYISTVLSNVTIGFRNGWWRLSNYKDLFKGGWEENWEATITNDPDGYGTVTMAMDSLTQAEYENSANAVIRNFFSYGSRHTLVAHDSDIRGVNLGRDCYWKYAIAVPMIELYSSDLKLYNQHRFNGTSYSADIESTIMIYSRVTIGTDEKCVD